MNENLNSVEHTSESRADHLKAAHELAQEILPKLEHEFPLAFQQLNTHLENDFVDQTTDEELDAGEILSRIQAVMDQRETFDQAEFSKRMEALAQGKDPKTGETLYAERTGQ